jgi:hypothetical protein
MNGAVQPLRHAQGHSLPGAAGGRGRPRPRAAVEAETCEACHTTADRAPGARPHVEPWPTTWPPDAGPAGVRGRLPAPRHQPAAAVWRRRTRYAGA